MIRALLDNPIAVREWRVLWRQALDWRIWVGVKWPLNPVVWGAPVILTYVVAPYGLWVVLALLRALRLMPAGPLPVDAFGMLAMVFWVYVVIISLVLGATAVTGERERQTWDQVRVTPLSGRSLAVGFLWGRLGPVWASLVSTSFVWWLLHPHYSALFAEFWQVETSRAGLAAWSMIVLCLSVLTGVIGLRASARARQTAVALVTVVLRCSFAAAFTAVLAPILLMFVLSLYTNNPVGRIVALGLVIIVILFILVTLRDLWAALEASLGEREFPNDIQPPPAVLRNI